MKPLVSVIVPVFKVEGYLVRCLDSLRRQSLHDIEFLLIDDASPDKCGEICEQYAAKDARFRVFHNKVNQGLSVARNIGIEYAITDYLMFVDSDDWVHEDFCKDPYECAIKYQVDLVMFQRRHIKKAERFKPDNNYMENFVPSGYKTRLEAMDLLHYVAGVGAWSKLYRKELFKDVTFPPGFLYEEIGTTYKAVWQASRIYYLDKALYYYCYRQGSITSTKTKRLLSDWIKMWLQQYHDLSAWGYPPDKLDKLLNNIALGYCMKKKPDTLDTNYVFCTNVLRNNANISDFFTWKRKFLFALFKYCRPLFEMICVSYDRKVC